MPRKTAKSTTDGPADVTPAAPTEAPSGGSTLAADVTTGAATPSSYPGTADSAPVASSAPSPDDPPEPVPLEVPLEEQITGLPPLTYPGTSNEEFDRWAADKRRSRLRLEIIGGALLAIAGIAVTVVSGRPAFAAVALFGVAGLAAYEFLVSSFE